MGTNAATLAPSRGGCPRYPGRVQGQQSRWHLVPTTLACTGKDSKSREAIGECLPAPTCSPSETQLESNTSVPTFLHGMVLHAPLALVPAHAISSSSPSK